MDSRIDLASHGVAFASRPSAQDVLAGAIEGLRRGEQVQLNFDGVRASSYSFLDELLGTMSEAATRTRQIEIEAPTPAIRRNIEKVLTRRAIEDSVALPTHA